MDVIEAQQSYQWTSLQHQYFVTIAGIQIFDNLLDGLVNISVLFSEPNCVESGQLYRVDVWCVANIGIK